RRGRCLPHAGGDPGEPYGDGARRLPLRRLLEARPADARPLRRGGGLPRPGDLVLLMEQAPLHVSTGLMPPGERVRTLVRDAFERYRGISDGALSTVYPALADASPDAFGISVASTRGDVEDVGDADAEFTIMSVAKPFVFALVCAARGPEAVRDLVGVN